ncbi:hypothetical protein HY041_03850 [Candidatus Roizmanbacteria bacterium]|nr:hypothetical protein [Candidatus Roizmanbacteria bacterium]
MKIYIFGNPLVQEDSIPLQILPELKKRYPKIEFIVTDPNENFPPKEEENLVIIDTVIGIKRPTLLDLDNFEKQSKTPISPHDYDLLFHLLLLKKMKRLNEVMIVGIPNKIQNNLFIQLSGIIKGLITKDPLSRK